MGGGFELRIEPPKEGTLVNIWGEFNYNPRMPWGPWWLTSEPKVLFRVGDVEVLECYASEYVEDEQGVVAQSTIEYDPCFRHFLVGRAVGGEVIWWHNLVHEYDLRNKRFVETLIALEVNSKGKQLIVKGYGGYGNEMGKTICINVMTGAESVM